MGNSGYLLTPPIVATAAVILVVLVIQGGHPNASRRAFLAVLVSLVFWAGFTFLMRTRGTEQAATFWNRVISVCLLSLFVTFAHFCHLYLGRTSRWPVLLLYSVSGVLAVVVLVTDLAVKGMTRESYGWAPRVGPAGIVMLTGVFLLIIVSILRMLRAWRREASPDKRRRLLFLAIAGLLPLAGILADGFTNLPPLLIWTNLAFCTVCSIVILRYRLFALRAYARKGVVRLMVGSLIAAPYVAAIVGVNRTLGEGNSPIWIYVFSLVAYALVVWPAYEWARWRLDRLFRSEKYDTLQALRDLARGADAFRASPQTGSRLTSLVRQALGAVSVSLLQPSGDQGMSLVARDGSPFASEPPVLGASSPLLDWFRRQKVAIHLKTLAVEPLLQNIPEAEKAALKRMRASLLAPLLTSQGALTGILVLGPKASRRHYTLDDVQLLENLGGEAAMALENARLYHDAVRARETLEAWLNNLPDVVAIVDRDDVIRFLNREGADRLGVRPGQRSFVRAVPPEEGVTRRFTETFRGREYEIASAPLVEPGGQLSSVFVMRDVTERRKELAEREQLQARARLTSHLASIGEMASGIAHEINNPLTAVLGYSHLLGGKALPEDTREALRQIKEGATRVAGIVQRLLTFARQRKPQRAPVDMNEVIRSTLALRDYALRTGGITVATLLDPALPSTIADAQQMQQVLINLIVNAEAAMNSAHGGGQLLLLSERQAGNLHIVVRDDGPGVPVEIQERIFDPFFTTREVGQGTGLGLSICHGIVSEHHGRIWVQSDGVRGSEFHLLVPIVTAGPAPAEAPAVRAEPSGIRTRVLVVDDEHSIREMLRATLEPLGHEVDDVPDGPSALERAASVRYGVILLDLRMPGMSGLEVFQRLKEMAGSPDRRVVFMTGDMMAEETRAALARTGAPVLAKPFESPELVQVVERALKG